MITRFYLRSLDIEYCFLIEHRQAFNARQNEIIRDLVNFTPDGKVTLKPKLLGSVVQVGPRMSMKSPWSSSAIEILAGCGIDAERFEMIRRYRIPKGVDKQMFAESIFDRMTEQVYPEEILTFEHEIEIPKVKIIPVLEKGKDALREVNAKFGLGLDEQDIEIYYDLVVNDMRRNPTDAEVFDHGQSNSDHSRHLTFSAEWTIDGVVKKETLFDLIKKPCLTNMGNSLVAFHDNSSIIRGFIVKMAVAEKPWTSSEYKIVTVYADGTLTFETHNHPTGVSPYSGAATGTGGRGRDELAPGQGGKLGIACAGFFSSNLNLQGYKLPWEKVDEKYPQNLASAREIIRLASDGACEYNNPLGEPVVLGCSRAVEMYMPDGTRRAWIKPIMASGGIGTIRREHIRKATPKAGMIIVQIGGPAYNVGFGGGGASSQSSGDNKLGLDFDSVQRGDPEMAIRDNRVVNACTSLGKRNPIELIHDQGAAGPGNALKEAIAPAGGTIDISKINLGDKYLPFIVIWGAEYQERFALLIKPSGLNVFKLICEREQCPMEILGEVTGDGKVVVYNKIEGDHHNPINLDLEKVLGGIPRKKYSDNHVVYDFPPLTLPHNISVKSALNRVLRNLAVASKEHYGDKGDRSVGGRVVQQQYCGPANVPVADNAIMALSHFSKEGQVMSIGEQPLKLMLDPKAGSRMIIAEGILNMASALVTSRKDIKSSVNWMWPVKYPGEAAAMYDACETLSESMVELGAPDRGKDSSSMIAKFDGEVVPAPRQIMITMRAMMPDVRKFVTPDIKKPTESYLYLMDLGLGKNRMGGSILAQCYNQFGKECPDITMDLLGRGFDAIQELISKDLILSYHDRSDGGLIITLLEMAFSGNCGLHVKLPSGDLIENLFSEEAGAVVEIDGKNILEVEILMKLYGIKFFCVGNPLEKDLVAIFSPGKRTYLEKMTELRQAWRETSYQLKRLQKNPDCALEEKINLKLRENITYILPEKKQEKPKIGISKKEPKVAIFREIGTNSDEEMVASFKMAGFRPFDVAMKDLESGAVQNLNDFSALAVCGGFSNGDVLGSARGWAAKFLNNEKLFQILWNFMKRDDTLSYWTCNGAQLGLQLSWFPYLPEDGRHSKNRPVFTYNTSRKFESRWAIVGTEPSPAIMTSGFEGSRLGVHVAHGEGKFYCPDKQLLQKILKDGLAPIRFVDDKGVITEKYPFNPNGSPFGITSLCTPDGRHFVAMPHLERSVQMRQWQYVPENLKKLENSPWHLAFENMYNWF